MTAAVYARKSTDQSGVSDEQKSVARRSVRVRRHGPDEAALAAVVLDARAGPGDGQRVTFDEAKLDLVVVNEAREVVPRPGGGVQ